jgi:hypothetical protein
MPGDELDLILERKTLLALEHAHHRHRHRHQRRLRVLGERQRLLGALPHDLGEALAERGIDLLEHLAGRGKGLGKLTPHADVLAALPGKYECDGHGGIGCARFRNLAGKNTGDLPLSTGCRAQARPAGRRVGAPALAVGAFSAIKRPLPAPAGG